MNILVFLLSRKIVVSFGSHQLPGTIIRMAFIIYLGVLGLLIGYFYDQAFEGVLDQNIESIQYLFLSAMVGLPVLLVISPYYRAKTRLIPKIYPVALWKRILIELGYDLCGLDSVICLILVGSVYYSSQYFPLQVIYEALCLIPVGFIVATLLQVTVESKFRVWLTVIFLAVLFILVIHIYTALYYTDIVSATGIVISWLVIGTVLIGILVYVERHIVVGKSDMQLPLPDRLQLYWNKKQVRRLLVGYVLIKGIGFWWQMSTDGHTLKYILTEGWMFFWPLLLLPIVFNTWGYYPDMWLVIVNNADRPAAQQQKQYSILLLPLLAVDTLINWLWAIVTSYLSVDFIVYDFSIKCLSIFVGYLVSFFFPSRVKGNEQDIATGFGIAIGIVICNHLLLLPFLSSWFYVVNGGMIITAGLLFWLTRMWYTDKKYTIYSKLFKKKS